MSGTQQCSFFTVAGASGLIGRAMCDHLRKAGHAAQAVGRGDPWPTGRLGHLIYAIGVTSDFVDRPLDTVEAHISRLVDVLRLGGFDSLLYLSSTRVYGGGDTTHEDASLSVRPHCSGDLYNLSKLMGESASLHSGGPNVRVARLSNVFDSAFEGPGFLDRLVREALDRGRITIQSHPDSAKDYIALSDVTSMLERIALGGRQPIYNLASGTNLTHRRIAQILRETTGCEVDLNDHAPASIMPLIGIDRLRHEFAFRPADVDKQLRIMICRLVARRRAA